MKTETVENWLIPMGDVSFFLNPAWRAVATYNCKGMGFSTFFPENAVGVVEAKKICEGCPVQRICLEFALQNNEDHGIWGGVSERTRKKMRQTRERHLRRMAKVDAQLKQLAQ